jgi:hypothetical protein
MDSNFNHSLLYLFTIVFSIGLLSVTYMQSTYALSIGDLNLDKLKDLLGLNKLLGSNNEPETPDDNTQSTEQLTTTKTNKNTLVYDLTSSETRTIIPIQILQPDGLWSQPVKYNFDTGATTTDLAHEFLSAFGYGPNGVGVDSSLRTTQPAKIKIVGLDGEFTLPVTVQDKAHSDLFRDQPPPIRYPLLSIKDISKQISIVFTKDHTTLRLKDVPIPELTNKDKLILLPDMQKRSGTPTSGWQWMQVKFVNPSNGTSIQDWFGLNTGDNKIVLKKQSVADIIKIPQKETGDGCNSDSRSTIVFIEANKTAKMDTAKVQVREEICQFARGGEQRNFGCGIEFLSRYTFVLWDLHRALLPV